MFTSVKSRDKHLDVVTYITLSQDEKYLFSSSKVGRVIVWYTKSWVPLFKINDKGGIGGEDPIEIDYLALSQDNTILMSLNNSGILQYWNV